MRPGADDANGITPADNIPVMPSSPPSSPGQAVVSSHRPRDDGDDTNTNTGNISGRPGSTSSSAGLSAAAAAAWAAGGSGEPSSVEVDAEPPPSSKQTADLLRSDAAATLAGADGVVSSSSSAVPDPSLDAAPTIASSNSTPATASASGSTSNSGGAAASTTSTTTFGPKTPSRAPLSISPAPFKRSASAKALAAAAAQINAGTAAISSPSGGGGGSKGDTGGSAGGGGVIGSGATGTGMMRTPTHSPMHRRPMMSSSPSQQQQSAGDASMATIPGPPPLTTASPLHNGTSSSSLPSQVTSSNAVKSSSPLPSVAASNNTPCTSVSTAPKQQQQQQVPRPKVELDPDPPILTSLRETPLNKILPRPRRPSKCPLFCVFYSEFDIIVGPKLCYQSPDKFMDCDITVGIEDIHNLLAREFETIFPPDKEQRVSKGDDGNEGNFDEAKRLWEETVGPSAVAAEKENDEEKVASNEESKDKTDVGSAAVSGVPDLHIPDIDGEKQISAPKTETSGTAEPSKASDTPFSGHEGAPSGSNAGTKTGRPPIPLRRTNRPVHISSSSNSLHHPQHAQQKETSLRSCDNINQAGSAASSSSSSSSLSIFDSTSEYIITGNDLADKMICLSTHNMHILSRPTIIKDTRYERNSLLFSVGFVLRRVEDPRPFRLLLSKLAHTLRSMEVESHFLSDKQTRPQLRRILQGILVSLNSRKSECNLLLDSANILNLKLFRPPREPAPPVPDHAVPVLLRPEWQLQMYDWDLTINWIVPHIDGFKHARLISQSSEVDMEMVRACLRVLSHHGVLALVDVFRYSNEYECTPLAASMLAGEQSALLDEAFLFISKNNLAHVRSDGSSGGGSRASTPAFLDHHHGSLLSPSVGDNPNAPTDRDINHPDLGFDPSTLIRPASGTTLVPPRQALSSAAASSYPPISATEALVHIENEANRSRAGGASPARQIAASHASSRLSISAGDVVQEALNLPPRRKERKLKAALAQLYSACRREKSFGDVLIEKVEHSAVRDNRISSARMGAEGTNSDALDSSDDVDARLRQGTMQSPPSRSTFSDNSGESDYHSAQEASISSTPREDRGTGSPGRGKRQRSDSGGFDLDWSEAFEHFDHRRFVTFGVIHGLIRRVHAWPMAYDLDPEECEASDDDEASASDSFVDDRSVFSDPRTNAEARQHYTAGPERQYRHRKPRKTYVSPTLQAVPFPSAAPSPLATALKSTMVPLSLGTGAVAAGAIGEQEGTSGLKSTNARKVKEQLKRLARNVAESMDGTRCDDELCCMYQKSLDDLLELIKTVNMCAEIVKSTSAPNAS